jgi:short chain dehydrogenase
VDEWRATLDVNLTGAFAMSQAVLPAMKARGSGRIVNVISGLAHRPQPGLGRLLREQGRAASPEPSGVRASVIGMLNQLEADPGFVEAEESAQFIRLVATGQADDLAGEACSIYDPSVRSRLSATASGR